MNLKTAITPDGVCRRHGPAATPRAHRHWSAGWNAAVFTLIHTKMDEATERTHMAEALKILEKLTGASRGWYTAR